MRLFVLMSAFGRKQTLITNDFEEFLTSANGQKQTPGIELQLNPALTFAGTKWALKRLAELSTPMVYTFYSPSDDVLSHEIRIRP